MGWINMTNCANVYQEVEVTVPQFASLQELLDAHSDDPGDCRCENCKWWDRKQIIITPTRYYDWNIEENWRVCRRASASRAIPCDNERSTAVAFVFDVTENAYLFTAPAHACSLWEVEE
jgi:hypothetical protein